MSCLEMKKLSNKMKKLIKSKDFCNREIFHNFSCSIGKILELVSEEKKNCLISENTFLKVKKNIDKANKKMKKIIKKLKKGKCSNEKEVRKIICYISKAIRCLPSCECLPESSDPKDCSNCIPFKNGINFDLYNSARGFANINSRTLLEGREKFKYVIRKVYPGTEPDTEAPVYGYTCNQKLIKNGGLENSYNPDFKTYNYQINYQNPTELTYIFPENLKTGIEKTTSYLAQRGYQFLPSDFLKPYKNKYFSRYAILEFDKCEIFPKYVDFWLGDEGTLVKYKKIGPNIKNGTVIPIRIPITTECAIFEAKYNLEPIAYYNCEKSVINIRIPNETVVSRIRFGSFGKIANLETRLLFFNGSYTFVERGEDKVLYKSSPLNFDYLAQCSETLSFETSFFNSGEAIPELEIPKGAFPGELIEIKMYSGNILKIISPENISGSYSQTGDAVFGPQIFNITGKIVPTVPITAQINGVSVINNPTAINGNIALIQRGITTFTEKVKAAQNAGAIACIIFNNQPGIVSRMLGNDPTIVIPSIIITQDLGNLIIENLPVIGNISSSNFYNGNILFPYEGDNSYYDNYLYRLNNDDFNAFVAKEIDFSYILGRNFANNPSSIFNEGNQLQSTVSYLDSETWSQFIYLLPQNMLKGIYYPEEAPIAPLPQFDVPFEERVSTLILHESVHSSQNAVGSVRLNLPTEALATSLELDYHFSPTNFLFRPQQWVTTFLIPFFRGLYNPLFSETYDFFTFGFFSYGASMFWLYLSNQFDYNNQLQRRITDLNGSEEVVNLFKENDLAYGLTSSPTAAAFSLDKALNELYNRNLKDTFTDFCIAQVLLRNNTSIPEKYRTYYPYWVYNSKYSGFNQFSTAGDFAFWWEAMQNNIKMPLSYISFFPNTSGEAMIPFLTKKYKSKAYDLTNFSFTVPLNVKEIQIKILGGDWRLSLLQFTSDGTKEGEFKIDGPYSQSGIGNLTFITNSFNKNGAPLRLVCSHVSITDQGGMKNYYGNVDFTGEIEIEPLF